VHIQFSIFGGTNDDLPPFFADSSSLQEIVEDPLWQIKANAYRDAGRKSELTINVKAGRRSPGYTGAKLIVSEYCSLRTLSTQRVVSGYSPPIYLFPSRELNILVLKYNTWFQCNSQYS